jgi:hypothetical protein
MEELEFDGRGFKLTSQGQELGVAVPTEKKKIG